MMPNDEIWQIWNYIGFSDILNRLKEWKVLLKTQRKPSVMLETIIAWAKPCHPAMLARMAVKIKTR